MKLGEDHVPPAPATPLPDEANRVFTLTEWFKSTDACWDLDSDP